MTNSKERRNGRTTKKRRRASKVQKERRERADREEREEHSGAFKFNFKAGRKSVSKSGRCAFLVRQTPAQNIQTLRLDLAFFFFCFFNDFNFFPTSNRQSPSPLMAGLPSCALGQREGPKNPSKFSTFAKEGDKNGETELREGGWKRGGFCGCRPGELEGGARRRLWWRN